MSVGPFAGLALDCVCCQADAQRASPRGKRQTEKVRRGELARWKRLAEFVLGWLRPRLSQKVGDDVVLSVRVTTLCDVNADLFVHAPAVKFATKQLRIFAKKHNRAYPDWAVELPCGVMASCRDHNRSVRFWLGQSGAEQCSKIR